MTVRTLSPDTARKLAIAAQRLDQPRVKPTPAALLDIVRQIGCLQLDPISAVARSHTLVLWSRAGNYDLADLDHLLWTERSLFEYWAHAASIVLTEDYPIHNALMRSYPRGDTGWSQRTRDWITQNDGLRRHILDALAERGPLPSRVFEDKTYAGWMSSGWTSNRNVSQMLDYLWTAGQIMVSGRQGGQKWWDLSERVLPEWTPRHELPDDERVQQAADKALRALGVGTKRHLTQHYTRGRYPGLDAAFKELEAAGTVQRVRIDGQAKGWSGDWYLHASVLPVLEQIERGEWQGQTRLLSPFDNLICDRVRTELLWEFYFRIEIYVPKDKRQYGYYVLPILHGDKLIGRIDPLMDRKTGTLAVNNVYAEPDAPQTKATARAIRESIEELAAFLGATTITYGVVPEGWK